MKMFSAFTGRLGGRLWSSIRAAAGEQDCFLCGMAAVQPLCAGCAAACAALPAGACPRCALPSADGAVCGRCLRHPPHFDATIAAFVYGAPLNHALQAFKYRAVLGLGGFLSDALAGALRARNGAPPDSINGTAAFHHAPQTDLVVPMPLFRRRLAERGFNQALELARPLARLRHATLDAGVVRRIRDTPPQAGLPWDERERNIRDAFICARPAIAAGRRIAVVDDVMTTGATLNEMARVLKAAGAAHVSNWVVARALPAGPAPPSRPQSG